MVGPVPISPTAGYGSASIFKRFLDYWLRSSFTVEGCEAIKCNNGFTCDCHNPCPATCLNPNPEPCPTKRCNPKCQVICKKGYVLDEESGGKCIPRYLCFIRYIRLFLDLIEDIFHCKSHFFNKQIKVLLINWNLKLLF